MTGESIDSNILFSADIYTDNGGHPGTFLGLLNLAGPIGIFYAGRTSDSELGTFTSSLTELDMTGMPSTVTASKSCSRSTTSSGPTTITQVGPVFRISQLFRRVRRNLDRPWRVHGRAAYEFSR